jgi:hypothetical protein
VTSKGRRREGSGGEKKQRARARRKVGAKGSFRVLLPCWSGDLARHVGKISNLLAWIVEG